MTLVAMFGNGVGIGMHPIPKVIIPIIADQKKAIVGFFVAGLGAATIATVESPTASTSILTTGTTLSDFVYSGTNP